MTPAERKADDEMARPFSINWLLHLRDNAAPWMNVLRNDAHPIGVDTECQADDVNTLVTFGFGTDASHPKRFLYHYQGFSQSFKPKPFLWVRVFDKQGGADAYREITNEGGHRLPDGWRDEPRNVLLFSSVQPGGLWLTTSEYIKLMAGDTISISYHVHGYIWN